MTPARRYSKIGWRRTQRKTTSRKNMNENCRARPIGSRIVNRWCRERKIILIRLSIRPILCGMGLRPSLWPSRLIKKLCYIRIGQHRLSQPQPILPKNSSNPITTTRQSPKRPKSTQTSAAMWQTSASPPLQRIPTPKNNAHRLQAIAPANPNPPLLPIFPIVHSNLY